MTGKRVKVYTITFKDFRVESYRSLFDAQGWVLVHVPDDDEVRDEWTREGIIGRRYAWRDIDHIDEYFNEVECSAENPCWGADCERCNPHRDPPGLHVTPNMADDLATT